MSYGVCVPRSNQLFFLSHPLSYCPNLTDITHYLLKKWWTIAFVDVVNEFITLLYHLSFDSSCLMSFPCPNDAPNQKSIRMHMSNHG